MADYPEQNKIRGTLSNVDLLEELNRESTNKSEALFNGKVGFEKPYQIDETLLFKDYITVQGFREYLRWIDTHEVKKTEVKSKLALLA